MARKTTIGEQIYQPEGSPDDFAGELDGSRNSQQARELRRVLRIWHETGSRAEFQRFSAQYLTHKGHRIAVNADASLGDQVLLGECYRALRAGY